MGWARGWQPAPLRGHSRLGITVLSACLHFPATVSPDQVSVPGQVPEAPTEPCHLLLLTCTIHPHPHAGRSTLPTLLTSSARLLHFLVTIAPTCKMGLVSL